MINHSGISKLKQLLMRIFAFVMQMIIALAVVGIMLVSITLGILEAVGRTLSLDLKNSTATNNVLLAITICLVISAIIALL